jgi:glycosyltransferase 2 family protein
VSAGQAERAHPQSLRPVALAGSADLLRRGSAALRWKIGGALAATGAGAAAIAVAHGSGVDGLWHHFAAFSAGAIAVACGAVTLQLLAQAGRLWAISSTVIHARWPGTLRAFAFGQVANLYLPARLGDMVKAGMLGKAAGDAPTDVARAAGAVFIADKTLDIGAIAVIMAVGVASAPIRFPHLTMVHGGTLGLILVLVGAVAVGVHAFRPAWWARLRSLAGAVVQGSAALASPRTILVGLSLSAAAWSAEGLAFYALARTAGHALSFPQCLSVLALLNLGIAVPMSVANVGIFEASVVLATTSMGVPAMEALALATVHHAVQLFATCALALALWIPARRSRSRGVPRNETRSLRELDAMAVAPRSVH